MVEGGYEPKRWINISILLIKQRLKSRQVHQAKFEAKNFLNMVLHFKQLDCMASKCSSEIRNIKKLKAHLPYDIGI